MSDQTSHFCLRWRGTTGVWGGRESRERTVSNAVVGRVCIARSTSVETAEAIRDASAVRTRSVRSVAQTARVHHDYRPSDVWIAEAVADDGRSGRTGAMPAMVEGSIASASRSSAMSIVRPLD